MANTLIKDPSIPSGGGGGGSSSGGSSSSSGGGGGGGGGGGQPPPGTSCFASIEACIRKLFPFYEVRYIEDKGLFRVAHGSGYVYHITGSCSDGYVSLNYVFSQIPGIRSD